MNRPANLFLLAATAALAAACGPKAADATSKPSARAYRVSVLPVETRSLSYAVEAVGSLEAYDVVSVAARVAGTLERLDFDEGDSVTPDQVLAVVDGRRYALEEEQAKAAVGRCEAAAESAKARTGQAEATLREAESGLARRRGLREKNTGWVSEDELSTLETTVARTRATVEETRAGEKVAAAEALEAKARLALAAKNTEDARVRSPITAVIERRHVATGQYLKEGDPIATLVDASRLRVRFRVSEAESVQLHKGQSVEVRVAAFPDRGFAAEVFHVQATADPVTRMVECLASIPEPAAGLRPGFFATVRALVSKKEAAVVIPVAAVMPGEQGFSAFVAVDGKAVRRPLKLGLHTRDDAVEVVGGLAPGESLVVEGAGSLDDGVPLEIVAPAATPDPAAPGRKE
jgi:RND family efflux transporter MFP subunit